MTLATSKLSVLTAMDIFHVINYSGHDAKELANQLSPFTPVPIPFREPINWGLIITIMTTTVTVALTARLVYPVIFNRWTWAVITISTMLVMTSGFMFVRIRGMPFRTKDHTMVPGFQNMVGAEIWTVASKCELQAVIIIDSRLRSFGRFLPFISIPCPYPGGSPADK